MKVRPHLALGLLLALPAVAAWRLYERPRGEFAFTADRASRWAGLAGHTPEELERGVAHRYRAMAEDLKGTRDVGYFSEKDKSDLWATSSTPAGHARIERYYMAQSILAPSLLRFDELHALIVIDCATPEQARGVLDREGLAAIRDFGGGLILAGPES